jgi:hypothetical protein
MLESLGVRPNVPHNSIAHTHVHLCAPTSHAQHSATHERVHLDHLKTPSRRCTERGTPARLALPCASNCVHAANRTLAVRRRHLHSFLHSPESNRRQKPPASAHTSVQHRHATRARYSCRSRRRFARYRVDGEASLGSHEARSPHAKFSARAACKKAASVTAWQTELFFELNTPSACEVTQLTLWRVQKSKKLALFE